MSLFSDYRLAFHVLQHSMRVCASECVGKELLGGVFMDQTQEIAGEDEVFPSGRSSAVVKDELFVKAGHSFDGVEYVEFKMKHDTGAAMMGVPPALLANPPAGVKLHRVPRDVISIGPGKCCYRDPRSVLSFSR